MNNKEKITRGVFGSLPIIAAGCVLNFAVAAESAVEDDLKHCATLQDQAARLACYDEIVARLPDSEPPATAGAETEAVAAVETDAVVEPVGEATVTTAAAEPVVEPASEEAETTAADEAVAAKTANDERLASLGAPGEQIEVTARVVRCTKDSRRRYYFYFENGQVWQQKSDRRLRYKECDFNVTITKDFFGYRMVPEGETGKIRIARVK